MWLAANSQYTTGSTETSWNSDSFKKRLECSRFYQHIPNKIVTLVGPGVDDGGQEQVRSGGGAVRARGRGLFAYVSFISYTCLTFSSENVRDPVTTTTVWPVLLLWQQSERSWKFTLFFRGYDCAAHTHTHRPGLGHDN